MTRKALITGISGQDGSYLAELLIEEGYDVYGTLRRHSVSHNQDTRIQHLGGQIKTDYADLNDAGSISAIIEKVKPDEIYNLAAQSHVGISSTVPGWTVSTNSIGYLNVLEAARLHVPHARIYQASSSEMFGNSIDEDGFQRETTPMHPVSPYGCSKLFSFHLGRHYRSAYNMFVSNGILFNHESSRRGANFVTQKIVQGAVAIANGEQEYLELGNLHPCRDWGHSKDYVKAMHKILCHTSPDDFVIATGQTHSIEDFCRIVFDRLGMDWQQYVKVYNSQKRPQELNVLKGDATKAKDILGWEPEFSFDGLIDEMIDGAQNRNNT